MTAGIALGDWKVCWTSSTLVDSALPGSQEAASFCWASVSLPDSGPARPTTTSQNTTTRNFDRRPVIRPITTRLPFAIRRNATARHQCAGNRFPAGSQVILHSSTPAARRPPAARSADPGRRPATWEDAGMGLGGGPGEWDDYEWVRLADLPESPPPLARTTRQPLADAVPAWLQREGAW